MAKRGSANPARNGNNDERDSNGIGVVANDPSAESNINDPSTTVDDRGAESVDAGYDSNFVDPATASIDRGAGAGAGAGTGKRRGRKPGTKNKPRGTSASQATADLSGMLFTVHMVMAKMVKSELLQITKEEAEELSAAITRVTQLYDVHLLDEKTWAFLNLALVVGNVYGTRLMVATMKNKQEKKNVVDMPITFNPTGTN